MRYRGSRKEYVMPYAITSPHMIPGNISGQALVEDGAGERINTRLAVRVGGTKGHLIRHPTSGEAVVVYTIVGTVDDATIEGPVAVRATYMMTPSGASSVVSEMFDMLRRIDPAEARRFAAKLLASTELQQAKTERVGSRAHAKPEPEPVPESAPESAPASEAVPAPAPEPVLAPVPVPEPEPEAVPEPAPAESTVDSPTQLLPVPVPGDAEPETPAAA